MHELHVVDSRAQRAELCEHGAQKQHRLLQGYGGAVRLLQSVHIWRQQDGQTVVAHIHHVLTRLTLHALVQLMRVAFA